MWIAAAWAGREWADESYEEGLGRLDPVASLQFEINMLPVKWEAMNGEAMKLGSRMKWVYIRRGGFKLTINIYPRLTVALLLMLDSGHLCVAGAFELCPLWLSHMCGYCEPYRSQLTSFTMGWPVLKQFSGWELGHNILFTYMWTFNLDTMQENRYNCPQTTFNLSTYLQGTPHYHRDYHESQ